MANTQHISLHRSRPYVFLPINLNDQGPYVGNGFNQHCPKLAVVDAECADWHANLHTLLWKTTAKGTVFRTYTDRNSRDTKGRSFRVNEQLSHRVFGAPPFSPVYYVNHDPLDCRKENLRLAQNLPQARAFNHSARPGSVIETLEGYNEALNDVRSFPSKYTSVLQRSRSPKLDAVQVSALLRAAQEGPMKGQSARTIAEWALAELGVALTVQNVSNYLKGRTAPVHGFDYAALAATRMNPRERALERWKERQK